MNADDIPGPDKNLIGQIAHIVNGGIIHLKDGRNPTELEANRLYQRLADIIDDDNNGNTNYSDRTKHDLRELLIAAQNARELCLEDNPCWGSMADWYMCLDNPDQITLDNFSTYVSQSACAPEKAAVVSPTPSGNVMGSYNMAKCSALEKQLEEDKKTFDGEVEVMFNHCQSMGRNWVAAFNSGSQGQREAGKKSILNAITALSGAIKDGPRCPANDEHCATADCRAAIDNLTKINAENAVLIGFAKNDKEQVYKKTGCTKEAVQESKCQDLKGKHEAQGKRYDKLFAEKFQECVKLNHYAADSRSAFEKDMNDQLAKGGLKPFQKITVDCNNLDDADRTVYQNDRSLDYFSGRLECVGQETPKEKVSPTATKVKVRFEVYEGTWTPQNVKHLGTIENVDCPDGKSIMDVFSGLERYKNRKVAMGEGYKIGPYKITMVADRIPCNGDVLRKDAEDAADKTATVFVTLDPLASAPASTPTPDSARASSSACPAAMEYCSDGKTPKYINYDFAVLNFDGTVCADAFKAGYISSSAYSDANKKAGTPGFINVRNDLHTKPNNCPASAAAQPPASAPTPVPDASGNSNEKNPIIYNADKVPNVKSILNAPLSLTPQLATETWNTYCGGHTSECHIKFEGAQKGCEQDTSCLTIDCTKNNGQTACSRRATCSVNTGALNQTQLSQQGVNMCCASIKSNKSALCNHTQLKAACSGCN